MLWVKRLLYLAIFIFATIFLALRLVSLDAYRTQVEAFASKFLGTPVAVSKVRMGVFPSPHLVAEDISVDGSEAVTIGEAEIYPDLMSWWRRAPGIRRILVKQVRVRPEGIPLILSALMSSDRNSLPIPVDILEVRHALVKGKRGQVGPMHGVFALGSSKNVFGGTLVSDDGKLELALSDRRTGVGLALSGHDWQWPLSPAVRFEAIAAQGVLRAGTVSLDTVSGKLYGGLFNGSMHLEWAQGWQLSGGIYLKEVDVAALIRALGENVPLSGYLTARGRYWAQARQPADLSSNLTTAASFRVDRGVLYKVDLAKAGSLSRPGISPGGETHFDELEGKVRNAGGAYRFSELKMASGVLSAAGNVDVSPAHRLSGTLTVQLRGTAAVVGMPLTVSGTVADPTLRPTGGALAGAAAGTAVLGPGVGTGLGIKAGQWLEELFR